MELLAVVIMAGILAAIAAPGWLSFLNRQEVRRANEEALNIIRRAQTNATQQRIGYQANFRQQGGEVQWAITSVTDVPANITSWQTLSTKVIISDTNPNITVASSQVWSIRFDYQGFVLGAINLTTPNTTETGQIMFASTNGGSLRRCVTISTLVGGLRSGDQNTCDAP